MVIGVKNHGQRNRKPWATKFTTMGNENQAVAHRFFLSLPLPVFV